MNSARAVVAVVAALTVAAVLVSLSVRQGAPLFATGTLRDFNAFYCAGDTLNRGANPFLAEPLAACERLAKPFGLFAVGPNLAMPAPLPGYALALFSLMARVPYVLAAIAWTLLCVALMAASVVALRRLTNFPLAALVWAVALGAGYASLALGQVLPVAFAAIVFAGYNLERGRDRVAAACAALATIEPHVGLPAALALFVWRPKTRVPLLALGLGLAAISFATLGVERSVEYVRVVLPAHALSEVPNIKQLSFTYVAHRFGASDESAVRIGDISYLIMLIAGVWAAGPLSRRAQAPALIAYLPSALAVLGGPFVHAIQLSIAVPAALVLAARFPERRRLFAATAIVLAIPWTQSFNLGLIFPILAAVAVGAMSYDLLSRRPLVVAGLSLCTIVFISVLITMFSGIADASATLAAHYDPSALAQDSWGRYVRVIASTNIGLYDLARLPSWIALIAFTAAALSIAAQRDTVARSKAVSGIAGG